MKKYSFEYRQEGICACCAKEVTFESHDTWLRDNLKCSNCGSIPRERALIMAINKHYPNWKQLKVHESSPSKRGASLRLKNECAQYTASQYYPNKPFGIRIGEYQNEDLEKQSYKDSSFDIVVTQDVMEHIYEPGKAFKEIERTLKKGGAHIFTTPLVNRFKASEKWALKNADGSPNFLFRPEYHGNPVSREGSPVTMHWGYDIVNFIDKTTKMNSIIEYNYNPEYGVWAELNEVVISFKV